MSISTTLSEVTTGGDRSLIDEDILLLGSQLVSPFNLGRVKGASYDIRVGDKVEFSSDKDEPPVEVSADHPVRIAPGVSCIVWSRETVNVPLNMKGRIFLRAYHAQRLIFFPGGLIDPGFSGQLRLPIANLSDAMVDLEYEEPIVAVEFTYLSNKALAYNGQKKDSRPRQGRVIAFDRTRLSNTVANHDKEISDIRAKHEKEVEELRRQVESLGDTVRSSQKILELFLLAAVAGGAGAAAVSGVSAASRVSSGLLLPVLMAIVVTLLISWIIGWVVLQRSRR